VISCFDRPETFFYLDPPYYGRENCYGDDIFSKDDFPKLTGILKTVQGKFILSINDHPQTREIFKGYKIVKVKTHYAAGAWTGKSKAVTELLISTF
jgi:DNA adenine methylase